MEKEREKELQLESPRINTDKLQLHVSLKPHQRALIYRMLDVQKRLYGKPAAAFGIMSDQPGAGKTYCMLTMLYIVARLTFPKRKTLSLIVVPYNICTQWFDSMQKLYGSTGLSFKMFNSYHDITSLYGRKDILESEVLLTTSLFYDVIVHVLRENKIILDHVIFDEADTIKGMLATEIDTNMTWFMSASIATVFDERRNIAKIGKYELGLATLLKNDCKCAPDFINLSMRQDDPVVRIIRCNSIYMDLLLAMFDSSREAICALDYTSTGSGGNAAATEIDACVSVYWEARDGVSYHERQIAAFQADLIKLKRRAEFDNEKAGQDAIVDMEKTIRESESMKGMCEYRKSRIDTFIERQDLCQKCFIKHVNVNVTATATSIIPIIQCPNEFSDQQSKLMLIKQILKHTANAATCKFILFSNYSASFKHIRPFLDASGIPFAELDAGNMKDLDKVIERYKFGNVKVLLADSSMYSCGMNLENTTDILFVHKMEKLREAQVIGRAQRYGRRLPLNIYYALYDVENV